MRTVISTKRIYDKPLKKDGYRVLVDRIWPRALSVESAAISDWAKNLAPSVALRKWFGHDPELWPEFRKKYRGELRKNKHVEEFLEKCQEQHVITLLYGAKDTEHNHAIVLREYLLEMLEEC